MYPYMWNFIILGNAEGLLASLNGINLEGWTTEKIFLNTFVICRTCEKRTETLYLLERKSLGQTVIQNNEQKIRTNLCEKLVYLICTTW